MENSQCPVCLRTLPRETLCELRCAHLLCNECITKLQHGNCPICRQSIFPSPEAPGTSSAEEVEDLLRHSLQEFLDHSGPSSTISMDHIGEDDDTSTGATPFSTLLRDVFPPLITESSTHSHSNLESMESEDLAHLRSFSLEEDEEQHVEADSEADYPPAQQDFTSSPPRNHQPSPSPSPPVAAPSQINMFIFTNHASVDRILERVLGAREQNNQGLG